MSYIYDLINLIVFPIFLLVACCVTSYQVRRLFRQLHEPTFRLLLIPGTALHELAHAIFAFLLGMNISKVKLWTGRYEGSLGYVRFSYNKTNFFQQSGLFFVGLAPLWLLIALIIPTFAYLKIEYPIQAVTVFDADYFFNWLASWSVVFKTQGVNIMAVTIVAVIAPFIVPSLEDVKLAARGAGIIIVFLMGLYLLADFTNQLYQWQSLLYQAQSQIVGCITLVFLILLLVLIWFGFLAQLKRLLYSK